ncbi:MAG: transporter substrate-binding domain-containing protein, partial [Parasporobacterium sp.]|nr:transporter substrate-binding domain-containing protein [Parasporobacterium sp.]
MSKKSYDHTSRGRNLKKHISALLALVLACGLSGQTVFAAGEEETQTVEEAAEAEKVTIQIAKGGDAIPYIYVNEDGDLVGFDVEVINIIFDRLPQYELEWNIVEWTSIFPGVDAGYYQLVVDHLGYRKERAEKYIYTDVYGLDPYAILVREDEEDIKSVYDLGGKTTIVEPGSINDTTFYIYNEEHEDDPVDIMYADNTGNFPLLISDGRIDFYYFTKRIIEEKVETMGMTDLKILDVSPEDRMYLSAGGLQGNFFIVSKEMPQLAEDMNEAFEAAVEDGTIHALREEYFGI